MAFVRKKGTRFCLVESVRNGSQVRQRVIAYLGASPTARDAIAASERGISDEQSNLKVLRSELRRWMREPEQWMEYDKGNKMRDFYRSAKVNPLNKQITAATSRIRRYRRTIAKLKHHLTPATPLAG